MSLNAIHVPIGSQDYWFKVVDFLQQNWALIDVNSNDTGCTVYFIGDTSGVFDRLAFPSTEDAERGLMRNGFAKFTDDKAAQGFIAAPKSPFVEKPHPNGPIYTSGKFWR
jgi:hypothetical protein